MEGNHRSGVAHRQVGTVGIDQTAPASLLWSGFGLGGVGGRKTQRHNGCWQIGGLTELLG